MRKSKYIGLKSGAWVCTHLSVARVQPAYKEKRNALGKRVRNLYPGHQTYQYTFDRLTSDGKAIKSITLNAHQARQVLQGWKSVEEFSIQKELERSLDYKDRVSYSFCD